MNMAKVKYWKGSSRNFMDWEFFQYIFFLFQKPTKATHTPNDGYMSETVLKGKLRYKLSLWISVKPYLQISVWGLVSRDCTISLQAAMGHSN